MKKILVTLAALAALVLAQGCQEKVDEPVLKAPVLTVSPTSAVIDASSEAVAVKATWTSAGEDVNYKLEIATEDDAEFKNAEYLQFPLLEKEFSHKVIDLYARNFDLEGSYSLLFRVTAMKNGLEDAVSNVVKASFTTKTAETPVLNEPLLSADKVTVKANPNSKDQAVSISWTSAAVAGITPSYKFEICLDESFSQTIEVPVTGDAMEVSFTGQEIAALATQYSLGESFTIYAKVIASAEGAVSATSNVISVNVTIDYNIPEKLYIYFWEWNNPTNAQEMENLGDGVFTWTGQCGQWEFKFITANTCDDDYWTGYFRDGDAEEYWTLKDRNKNSEGDQCMFKLNDLGLSAGLYKITVNCKTMTVAVEAQAEPLPEHLYLDFWGWGDGTSAKEMEALGEGKFTWSGIITRWQFKFTTANASPDDYWTGYFRDPDAEDYWTLKKTGNECMFQLDDKGLLEGYYTLNVDLNTLKLEVVPHIYLIGAFDWGWTIEDAEEMTYLGNGDFTWTGNLYSGAFKFLTEKEDWIAYNRKDGAENYWTAVRCCDQEGDVQFNLDDQSLPAGKYKIDFNPFTKAVAVTFISGLPTDTPVLKNAGPVVTNQGIDMLAGTGLAGRFFQLADWTHNNETCPTVDGTGIALWAAHAWGCGDAKNAKVYQTFDLLPGTYKFVTNTKHSTQDSWVLGASDGRPQDYVNAWAVACVGSEINSLKDENDWKSEPVAEGLLGSVCLQRNTSTGEPKANAIEFTLTETTTVSVGVVYSMFSWESYQWLYGWVPDPKDANALPWMDLYLDSFQFYNVNQL
ncbi:MAG: DUF5013 domain-containing protein [Bacteroidales bacterium]|nr:DUF5013 domain-containing protein [Bacteroidales bacterium]